MNDESHERTPGVRYSMMTAILCGGMILLMGIGRENYRDDTGSDRNPHRSIMMHHDATVRAPVDLGPVVPSVRPVDSAGRAIARLTQNRSAPEDSVVLDVTWLACSDTLESLLMMADGTTIYAQGNSGIAFRLGESMLAGVERITTPLGSHTDTTGLDSCTTIGVVLPGPRYLLLNRRRPTEGTRDFLNELATIRRYCQRRFERDIDRSLNHIEKRSDVESELATTPKVDLFTLEYSLYLSPIVRTWRCRGTVRVTAQVDARGSVRRAFVDRTPVQGKCAALLVSTALRGVLLSEFAPAEDIEGKAGAAWVNVDVNLGR